MPAGFSIYCDLKQGSLKRSHTGFSVDMKKWVFSNKAGELCIWWILWCYVM